MARHLILQTNKTYASKDNAIKAVEKRYPAADKDGLDYIIMTNDEGRFFPLFIGSRALQAGVHFHFNIIN